MSANLHLAPSAPVVDAASPIRVVLADDHSLLRRSLRFLLDGEEVWRSSPKPRRPGVGSCASFHTHQPHVLVLDLSIAGRFHIETIGKLRERVPTPRLWCSRWTTAPYSRSARSLPARSRFVLKDLADSEATGRPFAPPRGRGVTSAHGWRPGGRFAALAHRGQADCARGRGPAADRARPHERRR